MARSSAAVLDTGADADDPATYSTTRRLIVESAHALVRQLGPRRVTVEDVARASGVSRPTIYAHFGDKNGLMTAVFLWNGHLVRLGLERRFKRAETFADKVVAAAVYGVSEDSPLSLRNTAPESLALTLTTWSAPWLERAEGFWKPHVRQAQLDGEIRAELDPTAAARWVARSLFALAIMTPAKPSQPEMKEIREHARTFIAGGLGYHERARNARGRKDVAAAS